MVTDLPIAFAGLCIILGILYAAGLYFRERKHDIPVWIRWVLAISRGLAVTVLAFLLLSPLYKKLFRNTEEPLVIIAQDNSGSLAFQKDSLFMREEYPRMLDNFQSSLEGKFRVQSYLFGDELEKLGPGQSFSAHLDYGDKRTNMAAFLKEVRELYENRNVGAVIIGSDGIYNSGINPLYAIDRSGHSYYALALGDTSVRKDLLISNVRYNRVSYLNNKFPVEVTLTANRLDGERGLLRIIHNDTVKVSDNFRIDGDAWVNTFNFVMEARGTGLQRYRISVMPLEDEIGTGNNYRDIYIDVLDVRSKILIIADAPHPDITAMKEAIRSNINYEVRDILAGDLDDELDAYSLVILHQLPSARNAADDILQQLKEKDIPYLLVMGTQTSIPRFNAMSVGLQMQATGQEVQEALPVIDKNFNLFTVSEELANTMPQLPPLNVTFGTYEVSNAVVPFLNQRVGTLVTARPLIFFGRDLDRKWGVVMGTGLWKWRIYSYGRNGDHIAFNELINKSIQYLSLKEDRSRFRIVYDQSLYDNQPVLFDAEVYNKSYELITDPEVEIKVRDEEGNIFPYSMPRIGDSYRLNAGHFEPGIYDFTASVKLADTTMYSYGTFVVNEVNIEMLNTTADHNLLFNIAERTGGSMYRPSQLEELADKLNQSDDLKPVIYVQNKFVPLIDVPWILVAVFLLLAVEWFARRRQGAY